MNAAWIALIGCGVLGAGAVVATVTASRRRLVGPLSLLFTAVAAALVFPDALGVLIGGVTVTTGPLLTLPSLGAQLVFRVDPLTAFFLLIISVVSTLAALYSVGYIRRYERENLVRYYPLLLLFFAGIIGVVCSADWLFFLVFWEFMTLCSYFLVIFEKESPTAPRAGLKYIVMTHAATALMLIAVLVVWRFSHSFSFDAARVTLTRLTVTSPALVHVLLALWFVGFATKAGLLPFGDWLPDAYAAAPTSASAAFGGTMTKLAVYGLLRVFVNLLPASEITTLWGVIIAVFGTVSIFMGTLTALAQSDSKRLMSWHVIGQMGYIVLGIGTGLYLLADHPALGMLALMAGMFHLLNNVCYKSVLFMNAGSALLRTGERDLNRMSGLGSFMPITGATALIASLSIAGAPPLNGFASKWLLYNVTVLGAPQLALFVVLGVVAAFISLVTLASFLKFLGGSFLGQVSATPEQAAAGDVPVTMQVPQVILAGACLLFGLVPMLPLAGIYRALAPLGTFGYAASLPGLVGSSWYGVQLSFTPGVTTGIWVPLVGLTGLAAFMLLAHGLARLGASEKRQVELWNCGTLSPGEQVRYPAHSLYGAFKKAFQGVYPRVRMPRAGYPTRLMSAFDLDRWLFQPALRAGAKITELVSHTHSGIPQLYMSWQIAGLVIVIVALFVWMR